jgi:hypothetical protein
VDTAFLALVVQPTFRKMRKWPMGDRIQVPEEYQQEVRGWVLLQVRGYGPWEWSQAMHGGA